MRRLFVALPLAYLMQRAAVELRILKKPAFRQRHVDAVPDDDVIQEANVDQREGLLHSLGDQLIRLAGLGDARRMIVSDDDGGAIALQRMLDDLARMHAGAVDRAAEQFL